MNYLHDRRRGRRKLFPVAVSIVLIALLLIFGNAFIRGTGSFGQRLGRPFWRLGNFFHTRTVHVGTYFTSKSHLANENAALLNQVQEQAILLADRNVLLRENAELKEMYGRKDTHTYVLAPVLTKPNKSLYDTLIVDTSNVVGVQPDQLVFANGNMLIGRVTEVYDKTTKITLFSSPGEKLEGMMGENNIAIELHGKGAGNFELRLPRDVEVVEGSDIIIPSISPQVIAVVNQAIGDPRDPFQKVLARSPVNIFELKWVQIRK